MHISDITITIFIIGYWAHLDREHSWAITEILLLRLLAPSTDGFSSPTVLWR